MKFTRLQISIILGVSVLSWFSVLWVQGTPVTLAHLTPFSSVLAVLVIFALAIEKVLWSKRWLQKWFISRPDIRGTWHVELQSDWVDPDTNKTIPPIICYMGVTQTLSTLQMHLMTSESESWFVASNITESASGHGYQVCAVYSNKPNVRIRQDRSNIHLGALIFETHGESEILPSSMTGEYWTDRKTTGTIKLSDRAEKLMTRYIDAHNYFEGD